MKWILAIIIFSLLIIFHEVGHFIVARLSGVKVEEFSIGFGPRLLSVNTKITRFSLKLLPFGGSCRMKGMYAELEKEDEKDGGDDDNDENESKEEGETESLDEDSFANASVGKRIAIIAAGPLFNFLLAFICAVIVVGFTGYDPSTVELVRKGSPAAEAGLQAGDRITSFMGKNVKTVRDIDSWFMLNELRSDDEVRLSYERDGKEYDISFAPYEFDSYALGVTYYSNSQPAVIHALAEGGPLAASGKVKKGDVIVAMNGTPIESGFALSGYFREHPMSDEDVVMTLERDSEKFDVTVRPASSHHVTEGFYCTDERKKASGIEVIGYSFHELYYYTDLVVRSVAGLFTGSLSVNELSGPVGVVDAVGETYEVVKDEGASVIWFNMLTLVIMLSVNLGVVNLLPIPVLDGGRLVFLLFEAVTGKKVNEKVEAVVEIVFVILLMLLMVYVMKNDISRMMR